MSKRITTISQNLRKNATPWENKLWYMFLRDYEIPFHRQKTKGNYVLDFYCAKARLAVELDGGGHFTSKQAEYDAKRTKAIESFGIRVIRFSNLEIDEDFYEVCNAIDKTVKERIADITEE